MGIKKLFLKTVTPLIKWIGKRHWPFSKKKITGKHYYKWRDRISPGFVFMTTTRGEFSNIINPLKIKHAALYLGYVWNDEFMAEIPTVAEATGKGVILTDLVTFLTTKDYIIGMAPKFSITTDIFIAKLDKVIGAEYDYFFDGNNKAYYCYELVAYLIQSSKIGIDLALKEYYGKKVYDADSFLESEDFEIVFSNFPV